jgi:hypothetical protein
MTVVHIYYRTVIHVQSSNLDLEFHLLGGISLAAADDLM